MHLVVLNGWAASSYMLEELRASLPVTYQLDVLDELYQYALSDVVSQIDALVTHETVLMAWSLGGMLGLYYQHVKLKDFSPKALVLINTSMCFIERHDFAEGVQRSDFNHLKQMIEDEHFKQFIRTFTHLLVAGSSSIKEDRKRLKQTFCAERLPNKPALLKGLAYLETLDGRNFLGSDQMNTFFIYGEQDALVNAEANFKMIKNASNASVHIEPGMGHFPFGEFSENIVELLTRFLNHDGIVN